MATLEFFGAAGTVTGSMHVLHLPGGPVALDCGLFQGSRKQSLEANSVFPVRPDKLAGLLLSHAHIDHCGKVPRLFVHQHYRGPIYGTHATCDLARVMLADSAHIQEEDARYWNEKRAHSKREQIEPLYTARDAAEAGQHLRGVEYDTPFEVAQGLTATFIEAGHVLGSACILLEIHQSPPIRLLYTGDLGRFNMPILRDPTNPLPAVDYLITESTYANRRHADAASMQAELVAVVNQTRAQRGKIVIPAFSLGRTQEVVYFLSRAVAAGQLEKLPIFVDSPLSSQVTEVFKQHPECYDQGTHDFWQQTGDVFGRGLVTYLTTQEQSIALNQRDDSCVIIAAGGMCEHGRILHHLKHTVDDARNAIVIVGYQAQHTLGRRLVEKHERVKIFDRDYRLQARVKVLNGFSAHADQEDLRRLLTPLAKGLKAAFVVHGEEEQLHANHALLRQAGCEAVFIPAPGYKVEL
jgi:metallo-beta-lactamase family protein